MKTINPKEVNTAQFHSYLLGAVAPRPIAFVSSIDQKGNVNLSPFSFFNAFGANPPTLIFSPARRVRDNTTKHTLENVYEVDEVVVNIVNYTMVEQMSLASTEYEKGINEFIKSGLTPVPSVLVKPPRVEESPASFECKVKQVIQTGEEGGAGNLVICEVILAHFKDDIFDLQGKIDPFKLDAVARMGGDWYCRANGDALFEIEKPVSKKGIGYDQIPEKIRNSTILTGNNLGKLGNTEVLPNSEEIKVFAEESQIKEIFTKFADQPELLETHLHLLAQKFLNANQTDNAWKTLLLVS